MLCLQLFQSTEPGDCFPVDSLSELGSNLDQFDLQDSIWPECLNFIGQTLREHINPWGILLLDDDLSDIGIPLSSCCKRVVVASELCLSCRPVSTHLQLFIWWLQFHPVDFPLLDLDTV